MDFAKKFVHLGLPTAKFIAHGASKM